MQEGKMDGAVAVDVLPGVVSDGGEGLGLVPVVPIPSAGDSKRSVQPSVAALRAQRDELRWQAVAVQQDPLCDARASQRNEWTQGGDGDLDAWGSFSLGDACEPCGNCAMQAICALWIAQNVLWSSSSGLRDQVPLFLRSRCFRPLALIRSRLCAVGRWRC
jgi:hypothetical protein